MGLIESLSSAEVPVEPDAPEAQEWMIEELSKPEYQAAQPTLLDLIAEAVRDWLFSLLSGQVGAPPEVGLAIALVLAAVAVGLAFLIFGVPRLGRRSTVIGALFGEDDARSAEQLRRAGESALSRGDYATAIAEFYRAIARGLAERTLVTTLPGTTAQGFAAAAAQPFPEHRERLVAAAGSFDEVRYLGHPGTAEQARQLRSLERELAAARPVLEVVTG